MDGKNKHLVIVTGPTAVGKTAFSIQLAQHFKTEILSADSRQFYREMRIGTAYPSPEELKASRHHFIGNLSLEDEYNVSHYESETLLLLRELHQSYDVVILTGGSGLYIDAVCKGIDDLPDHDPQLRQNLKEEMDAHGIEAFGEKLKNLDPEYYDVVDHRNPNRLLRAVEVCLQTGDTYTSLRKNKSKSRPFNIVKIGLNVDRKILFERISQRVDKMMDDGLLEEVHSLLPYREYNALKTVGYQEIFRHMDGELSLEEAVEKIKTNTRRYAKRQLTWFKRDEEMRWYRPDEIDDVLSYVNTRIREYESL